MLPGQRNGPADAQLPDRAFRHAIANLPIPDLSRCDFPFMFGSNRLATHGSIFRAPRIAEDLDAIAKRGLEARGRVRSTRIKHAMRTRDRATELLIVIGFPGVLVLSDNMSAFRRFAMPASFRTGDRSP